MSFAGVVVFGATEASIQWGRLYVTPVASELAPLDQLIDASRKG